MGRADKGRKPADAKRTVAIALSRRREIRRPGQAPHWHEAMSARTRTIIRRLVAEAPENRP